MPRYINGWGYAASLELRTVKWSTNRTACGTLEMRPSEATLSVIANMMWRNPVKTADSCPVSEPRTSGMRIRLISVVFKISVLVAGGLCAGSRCCSYRLTQKYTILKGEFISLSDKKLKYLWGGCHSYKMSVVRRLLYALKNIPQDEVVQRW
jgi:hypothetical protein